MSTRKKGEMTRLRSRKAMLLLLLPLFLAATSLSIGCQVTTNVSKEELSRRPPLPELDLTRDEHVARVFEYRCQTTCHVLPKPAEYAAWEWPLILDEYGPRAGLTEEERRYLEPWLMKRAGR